MKQRASKWSPVVAVGLHECCLWILRQRYRVRVDGHSMEPALSHGSHVLVRKGAQPVVGDIVLCDHPYQSDMRVLKRVETIDDEALFLLGDNPEESTDSRSFGPVPLARLIGVVTSKMG